ncbi:hypothetical protein DXG01_012817 [Tephrocybe rancida]|nr:hypothetical protein DXG01_012817 [Tephrocybe rancida]
MSSSVTKVGQKIGHQQTRITKNKGEATLDDPVPEVRTPTIRQVGTFGPGPSSKPGTKGASIYHQTFENAIESFAESAQLGLDVLTEIASIHPFIAAPVMAFKLVVILDLKRRENNAKVLAVKVQMQSMMSILFQLRDIKDPEETGPDGLTLPGRLQTLMDEIAKYIKECASACDLYMKKSCIRKYLKSFIYETRLAEFATRFSEYETEIQRALSMHTTLGVDAANVKLDKQGARLEDVQNQMRELLVRLDTPREKEIRDMIETRGGPKACIIDDQNLQALIDKSGEDISNLTGRLESGLKKMRESLLNELAESFEDALRSNLALFEGKLDIQKHELDVIARQGDRILAYLSGGHERISDPQIREIWMEMGWKNTVKARHFVLALRDYFLGGKGAQRQFSSTPPLQLHSPPPTSPPAEHSDYAFPVPRRYNNDEWAQSYVNVSYLQAIAESIDDDGSGFINIQEVNNFTMMRPKGWSLLQWLAYWAAGWHSSISIYSTKIYRVLNKIYKLRQKVRPDNRMALDTHLDKPKLYQLELLLRSTKPISEGTVIAPELANLRDEFNTEEEERIRDNLEKISYTIDSTATVSLVTGPGRIERYIFPLLYLLLKEHVKTVQLARTHTIHIHEFQTSYDSLSYVFSSFDTRLQDLTAIFRQMHVNPKYQFETFSFGMFELPYNSPSWTVAGYSLVPVWDQLIAEPGEDEDVDNCPNDIPLSVLKFGPQEPFNYPAPGPVTHTESFDGRLEGTWAGYCLRMLDGKLVPHEGLFRLDIGRSNESLISGKADGYMGSLELTGLLTTEGGEGTKHSVDFIMSYEDGYWIRCVGDLDPSTATIMGDWFSTDFTGEPKSTPGSDSNNRCDGSFQFFRTPATLVRFRYSQEAFQNNNARARWAFACAAVLYQVQRDRLSKDFVVTHLRNGRRFKELALKRLIERTGDTKRTPFTEAERQELRELESNICPSVDQFYYSIARFIHQRLTYHLGVGCDGCGRKILQSRLICIVCIDKTLVDSLDFCIDCQNAELPQHATHNSSHSLIRGDRFLHDCERAWMIPKARGMSERLKTIFRNRASVSPEGKADAKELGAHERAQSEVGDSFVCDDCDEKHQLPPLPEKMVATPATMIHAMLRIKDDKVVEIPDDDQLARVEQRLTGVKSNVEARLQSLETELKTRTSALESILTDQTKNGAALDAQRDFTADASIIHQHFGPLEERTEVIQHRLESLEARFTSLEKLLQDFLTRASST